MKFARSYGVVVAKMTECDGIPDRIFFLPHQPLIIEFKAKGVEVEALQSWYLKTLKASGYEVYAVDTWEDFLKLWKRLYRPALKTSKLARSSATKHTVKSAP